MYPPLALRALTDAALLARLEMLANQERESLADVVEHLIEVDRRETVIDGGYSSLFEYCVKKLGYSEGAAFLRIRAARAAAEFPDVIERLRSGRLHLDAVARLYPHLTPENNRQMLDRVAGASKRQVLALVASLRTEPAPQRDVIVPAAPARPIEAMPTNEAARQPATAMPEIVPRPQHRFHFTGDDELLSMIGRLRALLKHKYPDGWIEGIFKEAAALLLEKLEQRHQATKRSLAGIVPKAERHGSRLVPKSIKREVWARDGGRCAYVAPDGRRCESSEALEYDHILAWADGGRSDTADNIRLLCRAHNQRLGRKRFGRWRRRPSRDSSG